MKTELLIIISLIICIFGLLINFSEKSISKDSNIEYENYGFYVEINNLQMYVVITLDGKYIKENIETNSTDILLLHGFPTSSHDYRHVMPQISQKFKSCRVISFDYIGFGRSDKPDTNFDYSIRSHTDQLILLLKYLKISSFHVIAHDMGDSVLTEYLYRHDNHMLSCYLERSLKSIMFTNGGMLVKYINFRIGQRILMNSVGSFIVSTLSQLIPLRYFTKYQLKGLWGSANDEIKEKEVTYIIKNIDVNNGWRIMHKTIQYINDRFIFESRWIKTVQTTAVPCFLLWGDSDAVSPIKLFNKLRKKLKNCNSKIIHGVGHFLMLESPEIWINMTITWLRKHDM